MTMIDTARSAPQRALEPAAAAAAKLSLGLARPPQTPKAVIDALTEAVAAEPSRELGREEYQAALFRTQTLGHGESEMPLIDFRVVPSWGTQSLHENGKTQVFTYNGTPVHTSYAEKYAEKNRQQLESAQAATAQELRAAGVPEADIEDLLKPTELHQGNLLVPLDNGQIAMLPFARVLFGKDGQGGIRMHHEVTLEEVTALAFTMGKKHAILGQARSGGKGGIGAGILLNADGTAVLKDGKPVEVDLKDFSTPDMQRRVGYAFRQAFGRNWGRDGAAPDVQTSPHFVQGFREAHEAMVKHEAPWVATGKPLDGTHRGGATAREAATGKGVIYVAHLALKALGMKIRGSTVAVQGSGNVGWNAIAEAVRSGQKVKFVGDRDGGIFVRKGITEEMLVPLKKHLDEHKTVKGFQAPGVKTFNPDKILTRRVDLLIPAALGGVIDGKVAKKIRAKVIAEGANTATVGPARQLLAKRGVVVLADLLANAGGTAGSVGGEQAQNISGVMLSTEAQELGMKARLRAAFVKSVQVLKDAGSWDRAIERAAGLELVRRNKEQTFHPAEGAAQGELAEIQVPRTGVARLVAALKRVFRSGAAAA